MKNTIVTFTMCLCISVQAQSWNLTGNAGTSPGTNFVGTTDNKDFIIKTNNVERVRIYDNGNIDFINPLPAYLFPFEAKYKFYGSTTFSIGESAHSFAIYSDPQNSTLFRADGDNMNVYLNEGMGKVIVGSSAALYNCSGCTGYRLFVKDGIKTEKIKVEIAANNGWADYVLKENYQLMPLKDLENFINEKGHLPEVPTTQEAIKNGIELKEMNILLLKKIEELTLHLILQDKRITELENKR